jgi:hypothetical protein
MSCVAGYLSESVAREWFADPRAFIVAATSAVGSARPVAGSYRVAGHWAVRNPSNGRLRGFCLSVLDAPEVSLQEKGRNRYTRIRCVENWRPAD